MEPKKANDPDQLGGWRINGRLGEGGFGTVFLAEKGAQKAAIKVIRQEFVEEDDARNRLATEAEVLSKLSDPSIGKILDSDLNGEFPWIATEFINGPTLDDKVRFEGPLDEIAWFNLAANIFHAIVSANELGIIHKDIKPSNIILGETGNKLIDFGIAHISGQTRTAAFGDREGSTPFSSPEHFTIRTNPKMDVFSTAATLAYAAKGSSIWKGGSDLQLMRSINEDAPELQGLTENQTKFLLPLLEKNPSDRPSALEAHQSALGYIEFLLGKSKKPYPLKGRSNLSKLFHSKYAMSGVASMLVISAVFGVIMQNKDRNLQTNSLLSKQNDQTNSSKIPIASESNSAFPLPSQTSASVKRNQNEVKCSSALEANLIDEAIKFCQLAMQAGDLRGTFTLGTLYIYKNDNVNSEKYLKLAADQGFELAFGALGVFYEITKKDNIKAEYWYKKGVAAKIPENYLTYALFLNKQKKFSQAEKYLILADKSGLTWGTYHLGLFYKNQKNYEKARIYLAEAAKAGDASAMFEYADLLRNIDDQLTSACDWYTKAAAATKNGSANTVFSAKSALVAYCQSGLTGAPVISSNVVKSTIDVQPYNSETLRWIIPTETIKADFNYVQFRQVGGTLDWKGISFTEKSSTNNKPWIEVYFNSAAKDLCFDFRLIKVVDSKVIEIWDLQPSSCYRFNGDVVTKVK
jgi:serine/threonine protein kinase